MTFVVSLLTIFVNNLRLWTMYLSSLFDFYRAGRVLFALTLLISFQVAGFPHTFPNLIYILFAYSLIAFIRLFFTSEQMKYLDFLFDIFFISAMLYVTGGIYSFLTLLYLFPIFFSSVLIGTRKILFTPVIAIVLYGLVYFLQMSSAIAQEEGILNISLHLFAFSLIALAGNNLKQKMDNQEKYIKKLEEEKIKMQGYERLYRMSADLAHELKNPLASISAAAQFLKEGKGDGKLIDIVSKETKRLTNIINDFLVFSRPSDAPKENVNLSEVLKDLIASYPSGERIVAEISGDSEIIANRTFIEAALNNIIKNALEASTSVVRISLKTDQRELRVEVEDDGPGIDKELADKVFEPFFTTKPQGTGLGLAISYRIITSFGGNIVIGSSRLGGTQFSVTFPKNS